MGQNAYLADFFVCSKGSIYVDKSGGGSCIPVIDVDLPPPAQQCGANPPQGQPIFPTTGTKRQFVKSSLSLGWLDHSFAFDSAVAVGDAYTSVGVPVRSGDLGPLWFSSFHSRLDFNGNNSAIKVLRGNGEAKVFAGSGSSWVPSQDNADSLSASGSSYLYRDQSAMTLEVYDNGTAVQRLGQLQSLTHASGMKLTAVNSVSSTPANVAPARGHLLSLTDPFGRGVGFTYVNKTVGGLTQVVLDKVTDPQGRQIVARYDANANLSGLQWQDGMVRRFVYDSPNPKQAWALTGVVDENDKRHATFSYDAAGWAKSTELAGGVNKFQAVYDLAPKQVIRDVYDQPNGVVWRYREWQAPVGAKITQPGGSLLGMNASSIAGTASSGVTAGKQLRFSGFSQPAGAGCAASNSSIDWDANGNKALEDDFNGNRTCFVSTGTNEGGAASVPNLLKVKVEGLVGTTGASAGSTPTACSSVTGESVALPAGSRKTSTQWHPQWALKTRAAQPNLITTWVYNGQPDPFNGGATVRCVTAKYGSSNNQPKLPDGSDTAVLCKKVEQATTDATGEKGFAATLTTLGDVKQRQWEYTYNQYGQVLTSTDPMGQTTTYTYRCEGQATCDGTNKFIFTGTAPNEVGYYQGDLWTVTNAAGHVTEYVSYDRAGRVLEMKDVNGLQTKLSYSPRGWVTEVNTGGLKTSYEYWPTGLLKKSTQPDGSYLYYRYDDAHRLTSVSDQVDGDGNPSGNTVTYTLDAMGNRQYEQLNDASNTITRHIQRDYDALNRLQSITGAMQ